MIRPIQIFFILAASVLFFSCSAGAQSKLQTTKLSSKQQKSYQEAKSDVRLNNYSGALEKTNKLISKHPDFIDAYILKAKAQFGLNLFSQAIETLEYTIQKDSTNTPTRYYTLARIYQDQMDFKSARHNYQKFIRLGKSENLIKRANLELEQLSFREKAFSNPVDFKPVKLSIEINGTPSSESLPLFTADDQNMIFTRRQNGQEDLFSSHRSKDGQWSMAEPLSGLNSPQNEGAHALSADGRTIIFTGCNRKDGIGGCDLYISEKIDNEWQAPVNMGAPINSRSREAQPTLSADGRTLYFVSNRIGGLGGYDIWRSKRRADGKWSVPRNIGDQINSKGNDESPHLHLDGRHLYFMSDGRVGMGDSDLFLSKMQNGKWEEAINLGYPINTKSREGALSVSPDGRMAFFTSNRKLDEDGQEKYDHDIYQFELPENLRADPVSFGIFKIIDATTNKPIQANVEVFDTKANTKISSFEYLPSVGSPFISFAKGSQYGIHVEADGYLFYSSSAILFDDRAKDFSDTIEIALSKIIPPALTDVAVQPIILNNVFFASGSAVLSERSFFELNRLASMLRENSGISIQVGGHTDDIGSEEDNLLLSQNRAESVKAYLLNQGVGEERIEAVGYGESQPIADNESVNGKEMNRRTEFIILRK